MIQAELVVPQVANLRARRGPVGYEVTKDVVHRLGEGVGPDVITTAGTVLEGHPRACPGPLDRPQLSASRTEARGGSLHLVCARPKILNLLRLTGLDRRLPPAPTLDGALAAPGRQPC